MMISNPRCGGGRFGCSKLSHTVVTTLGGGGVITITVLLSLLAGWLHWDWVIQPHHHVLLIYHNGHHHQDDPVNDISNNNNNNNNKNNVMEQRSSCGTDNDDDIATKVVVNAELPLPFLQYDASETTPTTTTTTTNNGPLPPIVSPTTTMTQQQHPQQQPSEHGTSSMVVLNRQRALVVEASSQPSPKQQQQQTSNNNNNQQQRFLGKWIRWIWQALFGNNDDNDDNNNNPTCNMKILALELIGAGINRTDLFKSNNNTIVYVTTKPPPPQLLSDKPWYDIHVMIETTDCPEPGMYFTTNNLGSTIRYYDTVEPFNLCGNVPEQPEIVQTCYVLNEGKIQTVTATLFHYNNGQQQQQQQQTVGDSKTVSFTIVPYTSPSQLVNLVVVSSTSTTVNVTTNDATVQFEVTVLPQQTTTLRFIRLTAYNPNRANTFPFNRSEALVPYATSEVNVTASSSNNTIPVTVTIPITFESSIQAGMYPLEITMMDTNSVVATVTSEELQNRSLPYAIAVQDANDDIQPPTILNFEVLPSPNSYTNGSSVVVDVSAGSQVTATFNLRVQDTFSGLVTGTMIVCDGTCLDGFSTREIFAKYTFQLPSPLIGAVYNWTIPITMKPSLIPKKFEFQLYVYDAQTNVRTYSTSDLTRMKWPSSITLVNSKYDTTPPRLINIVPRSPTVRRAQARKFGIPFLITVQEDVALDYYVSGYIQIPDDGLRDISINIPRNLTTGGPNPVTLEYVYDSTVLIGTYSISEISLRDAKGNSITYSTDDFEELGIDSRVKVVRF